MIRLLRPVGVLAGAVLLLVPIIPAADAPGVTLQKGDRILFIGDALTQQAGGEKGYITLIKKALDEKHKDLAIEIINAGFNGATVLLLQKRVDKDVVARKPTIVFIYVGVIDVLHGQPEFKPPLGTPMDKVEPGLREIIGKITAAGAKVVLCTPTMRGEKKDGANKLDAQLDEYAAITRKVAGEFKVPLCDLRKTFVDHIKANNPTNSNGGILTSDGLHLNAAGNKLVAETMLKMLGL